MKLDTFISGHYYRRYLSWASQGRVPRRTLPDQKKRVVKDPTHEEYEEWRTWFPEDCDPDRFDLAEVDSGVSVKQWTIAPPLQEGMEEEGVSASLRQNGDHQDALFPKGAACPHVTLSH